MTTAIVVVAAYGICSLALGMVVGRHLARRSREDAARGFVDVTGITEAPEWSFPPAPGLSSLETHSVHVDRLRRKP